MKNFETTTYHSNFKIFESYFLYSIKNYYDFLIECNFHLYGIDLRGVTFIRNKKNERYIFVFRFDTGYRGESLELVDVELHEGDNFHSLLRLVNNAYKEYPNLASAAINIGVGKGGRDITVQNLIYEFLFPIIGIEKP